jgi:hypothetical protein
MPILSIIEKGGSPSTSTVDNIKNRSLYTNRNEKRCYFGLLSLRSGVLVSSAASIVSVVYMKLIIIRAQLNTNNKCRFLPQF